ncbi:hypothetical protein WN943_002547 [Citrus x changshan-huyou]
MIVYSPLEYSRSISVDYNIICIFFKKITIIKCYYRSPAVLLTKFSFIFDSE